MATGTEIVVLKAIKDDGGETTIGAVSRRMGSNWGTDYVRMLCESLGRANYIDVLKSGRLTITAKGKREIGEN